MPGRVQVPSTQQGSVLDDLIGATPRSAEPEQPAAAPSRRGVSRRSCPRTPRTGSSSGCATRWWRCSACRGRRRTHRRRSRSSARPPVCARCSASRRSTTTGHRSPLGRSASSGPARRSNSPVGSIGSVRSNSDVQVARDARRCDRHGGTVRAGSHPTARRSMMRCGRRRGSGAATGGPTASVCGQSSPDGLWSRHHSTSETVHPASQ